MRNSLRKCKRKKVRVFSPYIIQCLFKDAAIAYRLQKEYLKQEQMLEQQVRAQQQQQQRNRQPHPNVNAGPSWDFSESVNNQRPQSQQNNQGIETFLNELSFFPAIRQEDVPKQDSGSKKKTGFMSKMKGNALF